MMRGSILSLLVACSPAPRPVATTSPSPSPSTTTSTTTSTGKPDPEFADVRVDAAASYAPWEVGEVAVTVTNTHPYPIVVERVKLSAPGALDLMDERQPVPLTAVVDESGTLSLRGTYWEDNPGPQARAPGPPRWSFAGDLRVDLVRVLAPGASRSWKAKFRAREKGALTAALMYAKLDRPVTYYRVAERRVVPPADRTSGGPGGWGERPVAVEVLRLAKVDGVPAEEGRLDWPEPGPPQPEAPAPAILVVKSRDLAGLTKAMKLAEARFTVDALDFDLAAARAKAKIPQGAYTRAVVAGKWVLGGAGVTILVDRDYMDRVPGDAIPLIEKINDEGTARVVLSSGSATKDLRGHARYVRIMQRILTVESYPEKGGTWGAAVTLDGRSVITFLVGLEQWKRRMDGTDRVVPM